MFKVFYKHTIDKNSVCKNIASKVLVYYFILYYHKICNDILKLNTCKNCIG